MSSNTDQKLLSILQQISTDTDLDLAKTDERYGMENVIAEENAYTKKRSQEFLLTEMEQKLEIAEINYGTLKQQLDYMKMLYNDIHREDKHRKDRHKKRHHNKVKNTGVSKTLPLKRRFSSASVHKAKNSISEKLKSLNRKVVTYSTAASNTEEVYTAPEPQSAKNKIKSPQRAENKTPEKASLAITFPEEPNKETKDLEELNPESATLSPAEEQNKKLSEKVCNQEQQTDPLEVPSTCGEKEDFWYGFSDDANQMLEQCVHLSEKFIGRENQQEPFKCEPNEEEMEYTVLISGNSKNSTNNSCRTSGKRESKQLYLETPRKGNKKFKGKSKKSGSQSTIITVNSIFDGSKPISKPKRKPKVNGVNIEKKRKFGSKTSIRTNQIKPKITETVISVTTKTNNKKNSKMKLFSSRSTICSKKEKGDHSQYKLPEEQPHEVPYPLKHNNNLVELYHNENMNVNISEENVPESAKNASKSTVLNSNNHNNIPPKSSRKQLSTPQTDRKECGDIKTNQNENVQPKRIKPIYLPFVPNAPIKEEKETLNIPEETKPANSNENYEQPKGPSRFKYYKRNYCKRLNFKKIPFVAGTSTSPSHNLGLNIQQVLSIIKLKQPRFNDNVTSHTQVLDSSAFIQHTVHRRTRSVCPSRMHDILTKDPEKDALEEEHPGDSKGNESNIINPNTSNGILFGVTNKIKRPEDVWVVDQDVPFKRLKCTCVPSRRCTNYQQLLFEYLEKGGGDIAFLSRKYSGETYPQFSSPERRFRSHFSAVDKAVHQEVSGIVSSPWDVEQGTISDSSKNNKRFGVMSLPEQRYNVKGVLSHLHDDFNRLNTHYEQLQNGLNKDLLDKEKKLKLQKLEKKLQTKEEEINIIMDLYKEVSVLKQHAKSLRAHNGHSNFSFSSPSKIDSAQYCGKGDTPSLRLTKLLRIMQQFQYRLRQINALNSKSLCFYHCFMINIE